MSAYLDASVVLPILVEEAASALVDDFIASPGTTLIVSEFAAAEVASALSRLVRMSELDSDDAQGRLADFDAWRTTATRDVDVNAIDIRLAHIFVRRFDLMLRAPDALHAAVCRRENLELVTLDRRLALAAKDLGVQVNLLQAKP